MSVARVRVCHAYRLPGRRFVYYYFTSMRVVAAQLYDRRSPYAPLATRSYTQILLLLSYMSPHRLGPTRQVGFPSRSMYV